MRNTDWEKIETIVDTILDLPGENWQQAVDELCGNSPELKAEVTKLLESIRESEGWLEGAETYKDVLLDASEEPFPDPQLGKHFGAYRASGVIARGGMGTVYLGERDDGEFEHKVAIKVIRQGMDTGETVRLFHRERSILAGINHPGIAKLFDGGVLEDGTPYLIMEYVEGDAIDEYCDKNRLTVDQRLGLFEQVLRAVQYAHESLIIHRDLKPGNILVTASGQVKILDFGIAKMVDPEKEASVQVTQSRILTPKYAAPEQIRQEAATTATDMYALGIILYGLLTGCHPYDLDSTSAYQTEKIILTSDPVSPGQRVKHHPRRDETAKQRSTTAPALIGRLKGDLDAILLKAIAKDPIRRYRTPGELIGELQNYRSGKPISARTNTLSYRGIKFFKRNKAGILAAAGIVLLTLGFLALYTHGVAQERNQAEIEAAKAEKVTEFLVGLFNRSNPYFEEVESGLDQRIGDVLRYGADQMDRELSDQPEIQAEIKTVIGDVYKSLGEFATAETLLTEALHLKKTIYGESHIETAESMRVLALLYQEEGKFAEAESLLTQSISVFENSAAGLMNESAISAINRLGNLMWFNKGDYQTADSLLHKALEMRKQMHEHEGDHLHIANTLNDLATLYHAQGQYSKAHPYYRESIDMHRNLFDDHANMAIIMSNFAALLREQGDLEASERVQREALSMHRRLTGEESIDVALGTGSLGHIALEKGNFERADSLLRIARDKLVRIYGDQHPYVSRTNLNIGRLHLARGELEKAEQILSDVNNEFQEIYPPDHPKRSDPIFELGLLYLGNDNPGRAESLLREAHQIRLKGYPQESWRVAQTMSAYGYCLSELGEFEKADSLLVDGYDQLKETIGAGYPFTSTVYSWLVTHYKNWNKPARLGEMEAELLSGS